MLPQVRAEQGSCRTRFVPNKVRAEKVRGAIYYPPRRNVEVEQMNTDVGLL
jgi:hypothetical protein